MNRIDRVTAILVQLQSRKVVRAQEIVDRFGISLRTVYRDIATLEEAGVPIIGEAGVGYSIMEGYRLPPVMFNKEEAIAFLTAEKIVDKLTDPAMRQQFQNAMFKIRAVLRSSEKQLLEDMEEQIAVLNNPYLPERQEYPSHLPVILNSLNKKEILNIGYFANGSQEYSTRDIEPVGLFLQGNYWYLIAYCQLRQDYRNFRTDRINFIHSTGRCFEKEHPSLQRFLDKVSREKEVTKVVLLVEKKVLPYLGEQKYYCGFVSQRELNGKMEMTFLSASLKGFSKFYLFFAEYAEVLEPVQLKELVRENIRAIAKKLQ